MIRTAAIASALFTAVAGFSVALADGPPGDPVEAQTEARVDGLSVGLHTSAGNLADPDSSDGEALEVGGAGLTARYALSRRWRIEVNLEGITGETDELRRSIAIATIAGRFTFNPEANWRWSLGLGIGSASEEVEVLSADGEAILSREFEHTAAVMSGGIERRFQRFGLAAEIRAIALERTDDADGAEFEGKDSPIPQRASGGEFRLEATYYF